jgi:phosphatidate cytidylyltransferase
MKRILTALALIPLIVYVVLWGPLPVFYAVLIAVALICYHEYAGIAAAYGFGKLGPLGYAGLLLLVPGQDAAPILTLLAFATLLVCMRAADLAQSLPRAALLLLGVIYIFGSWRFAAALWTESHAWLLFALALNWVGDIAAYYVGRSVGQHRLAPRVSPKKSWEGSGASLAASILFGWLFARGMLAAAPAWQAVTIAAAGNVAGQLGDLAESAMKRGAGVKDSGAILPGHGGLLDRVDSTLFAVPVVYLCLRAMG